MDVEVGPVEVRVGLRPSTRVEPLGVYERRGDGHTLSRHCGESPDIEADRLEHHPQLAATGSFRDELTAQRCVEAAVAVHRGEIENWRRCSCPRLAIEHDMGEVVGDVLERRELEAGRPAPEPATAVRVILSRTPGYRSGFAVLTAYPVLDSMAHA